MNEQATPQEGTKMSEVHKVKCDGCGTEASWWTFDWAQVVIYESYVTPPTFGPAGQIRHLCPTCLKEKLNYGDGGAAR
jgi:hypothetical protein